MQKVLMGLADKTEWLTSFALLFDAKVETFTSTLGTFGSDPVEGIHEFLFGAPTGKVVHHQHQFNAN
jgi:hypothetical protein